MKTLKLYIELEYDESVAHGDDPEAIEWFMSDVIHGEGLSLHSDEIGDTVGSVRVLRDDERIAARDAEWLAVIDGMIDKMKPKPGLEVLSLVHGAESIDTLNKLKARMTGGGE